MQQCLIFPYNSGYSHSHFLKFPNCDMDRYYTLSIWSASGIICWLNIAEFSFPFISCENNIFLNYVWITKKTRAMSTINNYSFNFPHIHSSIIWYFLVMMKIKGNVRYCKQCNVKFSAVAYMYTYIWTNWLIRNEDKHL